MGREPARGREDRREALEAASNRCGLRSGCEALLQNGCGLDDVDADRPDERQTTGIQRDVDHHRAGRLLRADGRAGTQREALADLSEVERHIARGEVNDGRAADPGALRGRIVAFTVRKSPCSPPEATTLTTVGGSFLPVGLAAAAGPATAATRRIAVTREKNEAHEGSRLFRGERTAQCRAVDGRRRSARA